MSISVAKNLALFDLDNTLLSSDSDYLWGEFACENNIVNATEFCNNIGKEFWMPMSLWHFS